MVIAHLYTPGGPGGIESVVAALALGQRAAGHEVHVIASPTGADAVVPPALEAAGAVVHPVRISTHAYLGERRAVRRLCRSIRPAVLHTHGYRADVIGAGIARSCGAASVTTLHGFTGGDWKNRTYERLQRLAARRADAVVAVSAALAGDLVAAGVAQARVHLIRNAAPPVPVVPRGTARALLGAPEEGTLLGWVGRVSREKGLDVLLAALPLVPAVRVAVVGDGPERARLEADVADRGLGDRVTWCGAVPGAARLLSAFDLLVLSSRTEGTPMVLLEAMWAEVPVVATAVGGVPDVLAEGRGVLVPSESPAGLAAGILHVLDDPLRSAARVRRARAAMADEFAVGPWVERYAAAYAAAGAAS